MIKSQTEIETMRQGGKILATILEKVTEAVRPGTRTRDLENLTRRLLKNYPGTQPAFLGYEDYPAALCVSINDEVVHGLPSERVIRPGDLVSIDLGIKYQGLITDAATSVLISLTTPSLTTPGVVSDWPGVVSDWQLKKKLLQSTCECLNLAIVQARPGRTIGDISYVIQSHAEKNGFAVVRQLVGHGVGRALHEEPQIPNFGRRGEGLELKPGMTLAIEPMLVAGKSEVIEDKTTLAWKTVDDSPAAHFEHTVAITPDGPLILTKI